MTDGPQAFLGPAALGLRRPGLAERIVGLAYHAGLAPGALRLRRRDDPGAAENDALALGLASVMASVGLDAEVRSHAPGPAHDPSPAAIARAAADPQALAIEVEGEGWAMTLPLEPGLAAGAARRLDLGAEAALRLLLGLFDACLADWAVAGPCGEVAAQLQGQIRGQLQGQPPLSRFTWRGPDLLTDLEALASPLPTVELHRSITGAVALLGGAGFEPETLRAALPALSESWTPPPVQWLAAPGGEAAPLRPVSARLKRRQELLARRLADRTGIQACDPAAAAAIEARTDPSALSAEEGEELSAFVGEAAVTLGGAWFRLLDPTVPFPASLVVLLGGRAPFYPHAGVERWRQGGIAPTAALEKARRALG
ncbi:hypothetical protein SAMN06265365_10665 [Tistlia consotensis]|uniref:Uncharacterized protein n=1 Tax=Tistlia consotensis USBA 355 TaxID=560819 RepID=A0A1Y6BDA0_9PROT|nr:hypothetical protein [Tistlia consotensis]SMF03156.1 hypothetical protein SAMN05428998_103116 [Tistlia consotensis USBA 355]SNR53500.1 hypothetical protein SAMN06265365_10665 [Tistlia consotensis]